MAPTPAAWTVSFPQDGQQILVLKPKLQKTLWKSSLSSLFSQCYRGELGALVALRAELLWFNSGELALNYNTQIQALKQVMQQ